MPVMKKGDHDHGLVCHEGEITARSKNLRRCSRHTSACGTWQCKAPDEDSDPAPAPMVMDDPFILYDLDVTLECRE